MFKRTFLFFILIIATSTLFAAPKLELIKPHYGSIQSSFTELARTRLDKVYEINMPLTGQLKRINLQVGDVRTDIQISVTQGLTNNDTIVAQPTADMHDGMKI